ncbi:phage tail family protein [Neobacillus sp. YIM B02564]|uniref:Phage tail family protein n=1 Tax=Neobacillus paridis TaxID=2803862 RepID=A0ABS1TI43_9BACI|nr:phage tail domain-containing protein [Neobacillus paridis]MBL4950977.1 phage tail family protein [Neobacillus paridis]
MLESLDFHFDGISSKEMGLLNVRTDSGLFEEKFLSSRTINTVKVKGNDKSYLQSIEMDNISLHLTFFLPEGYTDENLRKIKQWFNQDYYKEFYFDDYPDRIYYVMFDGDSTLSHNGYGYGYFTIELKSNSPYAYSPYYTESITVTDTVNGVDIEIENYGDLDIFPEIWIDNNKGKNTVKIVNYSNGKSFELKNLSTQGENIYIDNEREEIETDLPLTYRYADFTGDFMEFTTGINRLRLYGECDVTFRYQYKFI